MGQPSHAAAAAIAALSDAEATQVLYGLTVWLIGAARAEVSVSAQLVLDRIVSLAGQFPRGRWQSS
jgi:hypothetical protein